MMEAARRAAARGAPGLWTTHAPRYSTEAIVNARSASRRELVQPDVESVVKRVNTIAKTANVELTPRVCLQIATAKGTWLFGDDNERLAYVGSSVLNMLARNERVSTGVYKGSDEQRLQQKLSTANLGRQLSGPWGLEDISRCRVNVIDGKVRYSDVVKGRIVEALFGAVYSEGGIDNAKSLVDKILNEGE